MHILRISGISFPPFSLRYCQQTLELVHTGSLRRTIQGRMVNVGVSYQKFKTRIEGADKNPPPIDTLKFGDVVTVSCIQRIWQTVQPGTIFTPIRPYVLGTLLAIDADNNPVPIVEQEEGGSFATEAEEILSLSFCPILEMRLMHFSTQAEEWGRGSVWHLDFEEV